MSQTAMGRINRTGKVGNILITVMLVVAIVIAVAVAGASAYLCTVPEDAASVGVSGTVNVDIDKEWYKTAFEFVVDSYSSSKGSGDIKDTLPKDGDEVDLKLSPLVGSEEYTAEIQSDGDRNIIQAETKEQVFTVRDLLRFVVAVLVFLIALIVTLIVLKRLFKELAKCETPFTDAVVKKMRCFEIMLQILFVVASLFYSLLDLWFGNGESFEVHMDGMTFMACMFAFCLRIILQYGAAQRQEG